MPATKEDRATRMRVQAQQGGEALRRIRESYHFTLRDVEGMAHSLLDEFFTNQQVQRIETARVDSPNFRDVCLLATLYQSTPNAIAEMYDYWHPREREADDLRVTMFLNVLPTLPPGVRNDLLATLESVTAVAQMKAGLLR